MDGAYLYVLRCSDGSYYVGLTRKMPEERAGEHNAGLFDWYTKPRRPVVLVWSQHFLVITDAIAAERQIKGWHRAKKEALVAGRYDLLPKLARTRRPAIRKQA